VQQVRGLPDRDTPFPAGGNATLDGGAANGGAASTDPLLLTALVGGTRPANSFFGLSAISGGAGSAATSIACRGSADTIHGIAGVLAEPHHPDPLIIGATQSPEENLETC
jgi:hypothetical protein